MARVGRFELRDPSGQPHRHGRPVQLQHALGVARPARANPQAPETAGHQRRRQSSHDHRRRQSRVGPDRADALQAGGLRGGREPGLSHVVRPAEVARNQHARGATNSPWARRRRSGTTAAGAPPARAVHQQLSSQPYGRQPGAGGGATGAATDKKTRRAAD
ncbi:hypothetical protein D3C87_1474210 [compost metagenome]